MKKYFFIGKYPEYWNWKWYYFPIWICMIYWALTRFKGKFFYVTCLNPAIDEYGGFAGTSKHHILSLFPSSVLPKTKWVKDISIQAQEVLEFAELCNFQVFIKPDGLERGIQVYEFRDKASFLQGMTPLKGAWVIQESLPIEEEFAVFIVKFPNTPLKITSLTTKTFLYVVGDGIHSAEELLKNHLRYYFCKDKLRQYVPERLANVPKKGEKYLVESVGNHNRGTAFHDVTHHVNANMEQWFENIMPPGIHYGRFDVKAPSLQALSNGTGVKLIEFNGILSEPVNMYDTKYSYFGALGILYKHYKTQMQLSKIMLNEGHTAVSNAKGSHYLRSLKSREML